jgi:hypothetical protein
MNPDRERVLAQPVFRMGPTAGPWRAAALAMAARPDPLWPGCDAADPDLVRGARRLFPEQRRVLQLSIAVDLRRIPDLLKMNRQRAPRQMWNNVERPLHVLANLVIAVGFIPSSLDREGSGAPARVRHDRVRAHERATRGRVDGVSLGRAQGKQKRAGCGELRRRGESGGSTGFCHRNMLPTRSVHSYPPNGNLKRPDRPPSPRRRSTR